MSSDQLPAILVARYLKAHHYTKTLEAFLQETNLTEQAAVTSKGDWTLEKILEEKIQFDTSINFERIDNQSSHGWTQPAPTIAKEPGLTTTTNVLCVSGSPSDGCLAISTANNTCGFVKTSSPYSPVPNLSLKADSPILSIRYLGNELMASTTMSGKLIISTLSTGDTVSERRDHGKWAVSQAFWKSTRDAPASLVATAGWDQKVNIHDITALLVPDEASTSDLQAPIHSITMQTNPESLLFVTHPDTGNLYLVASRRDSSFLFFYRINFAGSTITVEPAGRQNLAPHSNAWVAFTPSALAQHPSDPTLIAIATSHLPHLKVIIVRLLFPDVPSTTGFTQEPPPQTIAAVARADLALQDREDAAISLQVSTQAPQTPYSTPQICWRPDGSGVWVNGDDGVVRGVEAKTGKVVALLKAHEMGSKVRTLWAGYSHEDKNRRREILASGGFDRKVYIWEVPEQDRSE